MTMGIVGLMLMCKVLEVVPVEDLQGQGERRGIIGVREKMGEVYMQGQKKGLWYRIRFAFAQPPR
ncbi:hypothetical protein D9758_011662 [Tetrapyrgos nigripes]|uniref:Uncharacterized protein n=1 Tax=Tetrapyrgos nigripes TaxID=182062 RepID=A0A8H5FSG9_9AGAR|nr:hypothetical protein D9758_011662 [Tetrapyrgos nigripes]